MASIDGMSFRILLVVAASTALSCRPVAVPLLSLAEDTKALVVAVFDTEETLTQIVVSENGNLQVDANYGYRMHLLQYSCPLPTLGLKAGPAELLPLSSSNYTIPEPSTAADYWIGESEKWDASDKATLTELIRKKVKAEHENLCPSTQSLISAEGYALSIPRANSESFERLFWVDEWVFVIDSSHQRWCEVYKKGPEGRLEPYDSFDFRPRGLATSMHQLANGDIFLATTDRLFKWQDGGFANMGWIGFNGLGPGDNLLTSPPGKEDTLLIFQDNYLERILYEWTEDGGRRELFRSERVEDEGGVLPEIRWLSAYQAVVVDRYKNDEGFYIHVDLEKQLIENRYLPELSTKSLTYIEGIGLVLSDVATQPIVMRPNGSIDREKLSHLSGEVLAGWIEPGIQSVLIWGADNRLAHVELFDDGTTCSYSIDNVPYPRSNYRVFGPGKVESISIQSELGRYSVYHERFTRVREPNSCSSLGPQ